MAMKGHHKGLYGENALHLTGAVARRTYTCKKSHRTKYIDNINEYM